jgi:hypothetical protein
MEAAATDLPRRKKHGSPSPVRSASTGPCEFRFAHRSLSINPIFSLQTRRSAHKPNALARESATDETTSAACHAHRFAWACFGLRGSAIAKDLASRPGRKFIPAPLSTTPLEERVRVEERDHEMALFPLAQRPTESGCG